VKRAGGDGFWRRVVSLTRKEFRQLLRDRSNLAIGIGLPMILIFIFGFGLSLDVKNAPVAVVLEDPSPTAQSALSGLALTPYLSPVRVFSMREAEALMRARRVDGIVRVPSDFSRRLADGEAQVQLLLQGAEVVRATLVRAYVSGALGSWAEREADAARARRAGVNVVQRMWFNAGNNSTWYIVPGLIVLIMTLVGAFLTALVMAREWERGTLEALFVSPVRPLEIILSKLVPYFGVGLLGWVLCMLAAWLLFAVPIYGSLSLLLFSSMLYLLVALGMGLLISSVTRNQFLASQVALVSSFLPATMLSGFVFDLRNVPAPVRFVGQILPATYFMELIRSLFLAGNDWALMLRNCAVLAGYAVVLLALAWRVTRKRLD